MPNNVALTRALPLIAQKLAEAPEQADIFIDVSDEGVVTVELDIYCLEWISKQPGAETGEWYEMMSGDGEQRHHLDR
jgi:hypothetical protein